MELELGRHTIDVTTRALIMGALLASDDADQIQTLVDQRPALVAVHDELQLAQVKAVFEGPVAIRSTNAELARRCLQQGADLAHDPSGFADPQYLSVVEEADAGVIVCCPSGIADRAGFLTERARWAAASGIATAKIIVDTTGTSDDERTALAGLGHALMITTGIESEAAGLQVLHVMDGIRMVASADVRSARRTVDTVAELLERRPASI